MVNWLSPEEIAKDASTFRYVVGLCGRLMLTHTPTEAFDRLMHALLGLYMYVYFPLTINRGGRVHIHDFISWEFVMSLDFDWEFITRKKKFRWPMVRLPLSPLHSSRLAYLTMSDLLFCKSLLFAICSDRNVSFQISLLRRIGIDWSRSAVALNVTVYVPETTPRFAKPLTPPV